MHLSLVGKKPNPLTGSPGYGLRVEGIDFGCRGAALGILSLCLKEGSLLPQPVVKNDKQSVEQMLKEKATQVKGFTLYVVGEGIEKKADDFAAEVAAQVAAAQGKA